MYIWKLREVVAAEGGPAEMIAKAKRASLSALWVKVADGTSRYANVKESVAPDFRELIRMAQDNAIEIWGWQVPHCATTAIAKKEAKLLGDLADEFELDGMIMDAEGTSAYFQGGHARNRRPARKAAWNIQQRHSAKYRRLVAEIQRDRKKGAYQLPANLLWRQSERHQPGRPRGAGQCAFDDPVRPGRRGLHRDVGGRLRIGVGLR
jgi:hypothetical protein